MIRCPKCSGDSLVSDSRPTGKSMRRRRVCENADCGHRWTTYETPANFEIVLSAFEKIANPLRARLKALEGELVELSRQMRLHVSDVRATGNGRTRRRPQGRVSPELSRNRRWSVEDDRRLKELYPTLGAERTAERLCRTRRAVQSRAVALKIYVDRARRHDGDCTLNA